MIQNPVYWTINVHFEEQTSKGLLVRVVQRDYIMDPGVFVSCKLFIDDGCCL